MKGALCPFYFYILLYNIIKLKVIQHKGNMLR